MNFYDRNFLSFIFNTVILQHYLNPSWFFSFFMLVILCFSLYSLWKYFRKSSLSKEVLFDPELSLITKPSLILSIKYILSIILLFMFSFISIGFINLVIRIFYSYGGVVFKTAHLNTIQGPEIDLISFQSLIQYSWLIGLFLLKSMFMIPSLFKIFINNNYIIGYENPKKITYLALVYLLSLIILQVINDYDVYLRLSLLSIILWICSFVSFCLSFSLIKYELDTFKNEYPLRSFSFFVSKIPEFGKGDVV